GGVGLGASRFEQVVHLPALVGASRPQREEQVDEGFTVTRRGGLDGVGEGEAGGGFLGALDRVARGDERSTARFANALRQGLSHGADATPDAPSAVTGEVQD